MTPLVVRPLAEADLDKAFAWFESRSVGLRVESPAYIFDLLATSDGYR